MYLSVIKKIRREIEREGYTVGESDSRRDARERDTGARGDGGKGGERRGHMEENRERGGGLRKVEEKGKLKSESAR